MVVTHPKQTCTTLACVLMGLHLAFPPPTLSYIQLTCPQMIPYLGQKCRFIPVDSRQEEIAVLGCEWALAWVIEFLAGAHAVLIELKRVGLARKILIDAVQILF